MTSKSLIPFLFLVVINGAFAQPALSGDPGKPGFLAERLDRIDDAINGQNEVGKIPGVVALIVKDDEIAYFKAFCFADLNSQSPTRKHSIFRIASMTKAITSVAVMILYEQGHLQLNHPVSLYIPDFAEMDVVSEVDDDGNASATVAATNPIDIIDLLTHSSGISY